MREFLVSYMGTEPPPTGGERPQAAQLLPACHMPTARILDLWEDHTMLKRQPRHQARLGGHQQLPLSLLVRQDQGDVHGKARPTEITLQGYEGGVWQPQPPLFTHRRPPTMLPKSPRPSRQPLCSVQPAAQPCGVGCSPQHCPALSPHGAARLGFPAGRCGSSRGHSPQARRSPDSRDEPSVAQARGPPLSVPRQGPATMSRTLNCCCETDGVSQAQGEAKVRGQGEQRGGTALLPTRPRGGGGSQATLCLNSGRCGHCCTQRVTGRLSPTHPAHLPTRNPGRAAAAGHGKGRQAARGAGAHLADARATCHGLQ